MDLDNPSYFSVAVEQTIYNGMGKSQGTQKMGNNESASECSLSRTSDCSLTRTCTPPKNQKRGNLRSFLRSVSSNSADSNQELLIMGEPRLSDIAPDLAFKHTLKKRDVEEVEEASGDEVFLTEDTATYYNYSPGKPRRHSIGTFINRERTVSVASSSRSFKEDFPQAIVHATSDGDTVTPLFDDHSLRHASYPRKRCPRCTRGRSTSRRTISGV